MSTGQTSAAPKKRLTTSAMIASIAAPGQRTAPAPFGNALVELAKTHPEIVGLTADLAKYTDLHVFAKAYPDRFYQMGMAEQLLMSAAAGMAREGALPFVTTYAVFASRRAYDFICMAIAEEKLNVKIVCALPRLTSSYGPSHHATEDIAIFRGMPDLTIVDPADAHEIAQATTAIAAHGGPVYMRLPRGNVPLVLDEYGYSFELGKAKSIRPGNDMLIVSTGLATMRALQAADRQPRCWRRTASASRCCTRRRSSRLILTRSSRPPARADGSSSSPRTTPWWADLAKRSRPACSAPVSLRNSAKSACRTSSWPPVPRPHAPRSLRHLHRSHGPADQGVAVNGSDTLNRT